MRKPDCTDCVHYCLPKKRIIHTLDDWLEPPEPGRCKLYEDGKLDEEDEDLYLSGLPCNRFEMKEEE